MIFEQYLKDTKGNVASMFAIFLLVLIAAIGSAIDYARLVTTNSKLLFVVTSLA